MPARGYTIPRLSPDGGRVALEVEDQARDIWIWDVKRGALARFTSDPAADREPAWTPDGRRLVFASNRSGTSHLYWQLATGTGPVAELTRGLTQIGQTSFSHDGRSVAASVRTPERSDTDVAVIAIGASEQDPGAELGEIRLLVHTPFSERNPEISPDDRWLAYESNETGQYEIYVRPFQGADGARWQVSNTGGVKPTWGRNGRELFYQTIDGTMMVVSIQPGEVFVTSPPRKLFDGAYYPPRGPNLLNERAYDVAPDGQRFLMIKELPSDAPGFVVVQHWPEELKRLVPVN
jgi:serine/threonine-protein kinase